MHKNYNSNRSLLRLPEYGRNILQMVDILKKTEDRGRRNELAKIAITVMGNINPNLRDSNDHKHKLWDHLYIMADFDLDIDSPYPKPDIAQLQTKPEKLNYQRNKFTHKQYGQNIRKFIDVVMKMDNDAHKEAAISEIAKYMKVKSFEFNNEYPSDDVILDDIRKFTDSTIELGSDLLNGTKLIKRNNNPKMAKNGKNNKNNKQSFNGKHYNNRGQNQMQGRRK